jgi:hypothetical protein
LRTAPVIFAAVVLSALLGCASPPPPTPNPAPVGRGQDDAFSLEVGTARDHYALGEAIPIATTAMYLGPRDHIDATSAYPSLVWFGLEQLDGGLDMPSGASDAMCNALPLTARQPRSVAFTKSGSFSNSDPAAPFWRAYFTDKELHLPAGTWRITATLEAMLTPDCTGPLHTVRAGVTFVVE